MHRDTIHYLLQSKHVGYTIEVCISGTCYQSKLLDPGYPVTNSHYEHFRSLCLYLYGRPYDFLKPFCVIQLPFIWPISHQ